MINFKKCQVALAGSVAMFSSVANTLAAPITFTFEEAGIGSQTHIGVAYGSQDPQGFSALIRDGFTIDVSPSGGIDPSLHFHEIDSNKNYLSKVPPRPVTDRGVLWRDSIAGQDPLFFTPTTPNSVFSLNSLVVGGSTADGSSTTGIQLQAFRGGNLLSTIVLPTPSYGYTTYDAAALGVLPTISMDRLEFVGQSGNASAYYMLDDVTLETGPSVATLAKLSDNAYSPTSSGADGYVLDHTTNGTDGFSASVYRNGSNMVLAIRGTETGQGIETTIKNLLLADPPFETGIPSPQLRNYVSQTAAILQSIPSGIDVTLTGHSLGGGIAQLVGQKGNVRTITFNAPGAATLVNALQTELNALQPRNTSVNDIVNYRTYGDAISLFGQHIGDVKTVDHKLPRALVDLLPANFLAYHNITTLAEQIEGGAQEQDGKGGGQKLIKGLTYFVHTASQCPLIPGPTQISFGTCVSFAINVAGQGLQYVVDPLPGSSYVLVGDESSPFLASLGLPLLDGVFGWQINSFSNGNWSSETFLGGIDRYMMGADVSGVSFIPLDVNGLATFNRSPFAFSLSFTEEGLFNGTIGIGAEVGQVPEPAVLFLWLIGLAALALNQKRSLSAVRRREK